MYRINQHKSNWPNYRHLLHANLLLLFLFYGNFDKTKGPQPNKSKETHSLQRMHMHVYACKRTT